MNNINWFDKAACKDYGADTFYYDSPDKSVNLKKESYAKNICRKCPVAAECLMHAIQNNETYGVWGSFAPKERNTLISLFSTESINIDLCRSVVNKEIKSIKAKIFRKDLDF